jgi:methylenetetrahydrofolate dehydrogenase (NADP+)/methenyltetrahydrofolate cyclohydrolase
LALLLEGKKIAQAIKDRVKEDIALLKVKSAITPVLACVVVGEDPASGVYCKSQGLVARDLGIEHRLITLKNGTTREDLIAAVVKLNKDASVHAIIIQAPLPGGIRGDEVAGFVAPAKDAEGLHPENLGRLLLGQSRTRHPEVHDGPPFLGRVAPCTAAACMELLLRHEIKLYGKEAVIVGHSSIVGKPLSLMMLKEFATTTVCHIATSEAHQLESHVRRAEILVVAVGKPGVIKGAWIKEGAAVIDVGINRAGTHIVGDVEFEAAQKRAAYITPVPGGVGPLTVAMLMRNCAELFKQSLSVTNDI